MFIATIICWLAFALVVFTIDPTQATISGFALFYSGLLLSLTGLLALIGLIFRGHLTGESPAKKVTTSFRQAIWFSCLIAFFLFLQSQRLLHWWNLVLFVLFLVLLEFFFISHRSRQVEEDNNSVTSH